MNFLVDVLDEWEKPYKRKRAGGEPVENFLVDVKGGRADCRQMKKIIEYAEQMDKAVKEYQIEKLKQKSKDDDSAYLALREKLDKITEELRKSIRKMNQQTMRRMIELAFGLDKSARIEPEVKACYKKYSSKVLEILYSYDKELFLSCFKKGKRLDDTGIATNE